MPTPPQAAPQAASQPTLRRSLTLRDLVVFGLLFIGPLAPVGVFGVLDAQADGAVALVYVLATLAMACTAWSYAQMSRVVPHAGSVFAYATQGLGAGAGFIAGWMIMLDYLLIPAVAYLFSGIALHALVPGVPAWIFTVVAFAITTLLNLRGVGVAARAGRVVLVGEIVVLGIFVVSALTVLLQDGPARPWLSPLTGMGSAAAGAVTPIGPVAGAISVAVLSYLGFDAIASFAEENAGDARQVGTAIVFCLVVAGAAFIVQSYLAALLSTVTPSQLAARPGAQGTAFYDATRGAIGAWLATVLAITKAIGPAFSAMTGQAAAARLLFGMARDGRLPTVLAGVDAERGVPTVALGAAATLTLVVAVWAARRDDGLSVLVSIVDVGALVAFTLLHASVVGYYVARQRAVARVWHWVVPIAGAGITIWVLVEASRLALVVGAAWLVLGVVAMVLTRRDSRG
ncbi:MAG: APC family permease [Gemmatimonadaceae bacterium]|nr:APC family permease [Gemmatimonadaceae bacterium]